MDCGNKGGGGPCYVDERDDAACEDCNSVLDGWKGLEGGEGRWGIVARKGNTNRSQRKYILSPLQGRAAS